MSAVPRLSTSHAIHYLLQQSMAMSVIAWNMALDFGDVMMRNLEPASSFGRVDQACPNFGFCPCPQATLLMKTC